MDALSLRLVVQESDSFKDRAKRKMMEEREKNASLASQYETKLKSLQQENSKLSLTADRASRELEGWKSLQQVNTHFYKPALVDF